MKSPWPLLLLSLPLAVPPEARAEDPAGKGLAIAREADRRDSGWGDAEARLRMVLKNRHGQQSVRTLDVRFLEAAPDGDRSLGSICSTMSRAAAAP